MNTTRLTVIEKIDIFFKISDPLLLLLLLLWCYTRKCKRFAKKCGKPTKNYSPSNRTDKKPQSVSVKTSILVLSRRKNDERSDIH